MASATNDIKSTIDHETHEPETSHENPNNKPYSIFTHGEKWAIVTIASIAGIFR
jgi:hypothetical protein